MADRVVVLGVDPGTIVTGYGVVALEGGALKALHWGSVRTSSKVPLAERLGLIHAGIAQQIETHRPDVFAIENVFQSKNVRSALTLGHARGVAMLAAAQAGLPVFEYAPREVKQSVVGIGSASKEQVGAMIGRLLGVPDDERREDESDALAVAVCHLHKAGTALAR